MTDTFFLVLYYICNIMVILYLFYLFFFTTAPDAGRPRSRKYKRKLILLSIIIFSRGRFDDGSALEFSQYNNNNNILYAFYHGKLKRLCTTIKYNIITDILADNRYHGVTAMYTGNMVRRLRRGIRTNNYYCTRTCYKNV